MNKNGQWCNNCFYGVCKTPEDVGRCNKCNMKPNMFVDKKDVEANGNMREVQDVKVTGYVTMIGRQIVVEVDEESFRKVLETGYVSQHEKMDVEEHIYIDDGSVCLIWKKSMKEASRSRDDRIRSNEEGFTRADLEK